ncbi:AAA family ATPase [Propionibacteriaceae bacterium Y2011]|uniref:AAA family ATPase n=1 Tax=Microlunatus sp. Y2014 TaxID=3418488 RepID=UPI003B4D7A3D
MLAVENYRSLRHLVLELTNLTVVTGANGTGKSSLYRALRLLADSARNGAVAALAREGGMTSVLWAGPEVISKAMRDGEQPIQGTRRSGPVTLRLGFAADEISYAVDFGHPQPGGPPASMFQLDPEIKRECTWMGPRLRPATLQADRAGGRVRVRTDDGWRELPELRPYDSMLSEIADPETAPELLVLREQVRRWRFYDQVRTDADAPARQPRIGTRTPVLSGDGADLAAAWQTIVEVGDGGALDRAVSAAFPGSRVEIVVAAGRFELVLWQPGMLRPLRAAELSDGTLRYLVWAAALLSPRPPELLVLNEPETSLHPELLGPLADLLLRAAGHSQLVVVSHNQTLVERLAAGDGVGVVELVKDTGETSVAGREGLLDQPTWSWPKR